jgi:hypothetical protein
VSGRQEKQVLTYIFQKNGETDTENILFLGAFPPFTFYQAAAPLISECNSGSHCWFDFAGII